MLPERRILSFYDVVRVPRVLLCHELQNEGKPTHLVDLVDLTITAWPGCYCLYWRVAKGYRDSFIIAEWIFNENYFIIEDILWLFLYILMYLQCSLFYIPYEHVLLNLILPACCNRLLFIACRLRSLSHHVNSEKKIRSYYVRT